MKSKYYIPNVQTILLDTTPLVNPTYVFFSETHPTYVFFVFFFFVLTFSLVHYNVNFELKPNMSLGHLFAVFN